MSGGRDLADTRARHIAAAARAQAAVGVAVALVASVLHRLPHGLETALWVALAWVYVVWVVGYFVAFCSSNGHTPGDRVMRIRAIDAQGAGRIGPARSVARFIGVVLATIPLLAGFLITLWDDRRRCLQDRIARTVVVHVRAGASPAADRCDHGCGARRARGRVRPGNA